MDPLPTKRGDYAYATGIDFFTTPDEKVKRTCCLAFLCTNYSVKLTCPILHENKCSDGTLPCNLISTYKMMYSYDIRQTISNFCSLGIYFSNRSIILDIRPLVDLGHPTSEILEHARLAADHFKEWFYYFIVIVS